MKSLKRTLCLVFALILVMPLSCVTCASSPDILDVTFDTSASVATIYGMSNVSIEFDADEGAAHVKALSTNPTACFPIQGYTADYKYAVITYRLNGTNSAGATEALFELTSGGETVVQSSFCYIRGYKYYSSTVDLSDNGASDGVRIRFFDNCVAGDNFYLYGVSFCKTAESASAVEESRALAANGPILSKYTESELTVNSYVWEDYMEPYWDTNLIINEAVYPLKEQNGTIADISLMYSPDRIISVKSSTLQTEYKEGVDYELVNGKLRILSGSSIPCVNFTDHYYKTWRGGSYQMHEVNMGQYKYVRFEEGRNITLAQLAITYIRSEDWTGYVPENQGEALPVTRAKLENGGNLKVIYFGDSITNGGNSSGEESVNLPPYAERWTTMFERKLGSLYPNATINCYNTSVSGGGWDGEEDMYAGYRYVYSSIINNNPDLVIIALGTNDYQFYSVGDRNPNGKFSPASTYEKASYVVGEIKSNLPNCEIILVAPQLSNPQCFDSTILDEYIAGYRTIANRYNGVVIADVNTVHKYLLNEKSNYTDMSANNLCHINDFLARVYAHVVLKTITPVSLSATYKATAKNNLNYITNINNYYENEKSVIRGIISDASSQIDAATTFDEMLAITREAKLAILAVPDKNAVVSESIDYENIIFDSAQKAELFKSLNYLSVSYNSSENAVALTATGSNKDSRTTIFYPATKPVSASVDKYAVLTYMVPTSNSSSASTTQLFFAAGSLNEPTENQLVEFNVEKDGEYHSFIVDLTSYSWWNGVIKQIRIDPFKSCQNGDKMFVSSLCLCKTPTEAQHVADERARRANGTYAGESSVVTFDTAESLSYITAPFIPTIIGDVNGDDSANAKDLIKMKKYITGSTDGIIRTDCFDLNRDGKVTVKDLGILKRCIVGEFGYQQIDTKDADCTKDFDAAEPAAAVSDGFGHYATFNADYEYASPAYAVLVYKATGNAATTVYFGNHVSSDSNTSVSLDVTGEYNSLVLPLPANYSSNCITVDVQNVSLEVDSFGLFEVQKTASSYAYDRLWDRQSPVVYNENVTVRFENDMMANIEYTNNTTCSHNSNNELCLTAANSNGDPYAYLNLTSLGISADEYKYILYVYKVPANTSSKAEKAQIFFCSDNANVPAEASSMKFDLTKNGNFIFKTLDLSAASYWGGNVLGLRLDYFHDALSGDKCYVRSIVFCKNLSDLDKAIAENQ